ncbi:MAG: helix-turn-helix transcriptional regulator [Candidatus Nanopelagicales bacterium]
MSATSAARLSRLLALVPWLSQHDGVSISDAAQHFGVTPEVLERDLWLVVCCGLPGHGPDQLIDIQFWDDDGRIHVLDPQTLQRPLRLTAVEATALLVGLRLLAQVAGGHDRGALTTAASKLEAAAGEALDGASAHVVLDGTSDGVRVAIDEALARGRALHIVYAGATRDAVTARVIDPRGVVYAGGHAYVDAWCRSAEAIRAFRTDRIMSAEVLEEVAAPPVSLPEAVLTPQAGTLVRLAFTPAGRWVAEALAMTDVSVAGDGSGSGLLWVADSGWLVRLVLGQAGAVEVREPASLRQAVLAAATQALGHYRD